MIKALQNLLFHCSICSWVINFKSISCWLGRVKKRLSKDELEDTLLPGKAITVSLSEVEYLGTSKIIKNVPSTSLSVVFQTFGALAGLPQI